MQVVIVEDEKPAARRLNRLLEAMKIYPVAILHSVEESINWFSKNKQPELIFLDIQLSDGLSFEIFDEIEIKSPIIFTTAYDKYALKAFKLNSVDYLLKPIENEELKQAIEKFKSIKENYNNQVSVVKKIEEILIPNRIAFKKRFLVKFGQHLKLIAVDHVQCFFSENKGTYLHTSNNRTYLIDKSLEELEQQLNPQHFFRVNRKFLVNIQFIMEILAFSNSRLKLKLNQFNEHEIIVSRDRVKSFKSWIAK
ncbi:MAG: LytR/AlgR family response regulator transcription factor [Lutibacter sp.]